MFIYNLFIAQFVTSEGKQEKESDVVWKSLSCTREYCVIHNKPSMHNGQYFTTHKYADDTFFFLPATWAVVCTGNSASNFKTKTQQVLHLGLA